MKQIYPVVLAGGGGLRLWPMSGGDKPKQFLSLLGDDSLFTQTAKRLVGFCPMERLRVVCGDRHREHVLKELEALKQTDAAMVISEPYAMNTAPAILLAIEQIAREADDPILVVLPADHSIHDLPLFHAALTRAAEAASRGGIVTLGITPTAPETGYGYIESEANHGGGRVVPVKRFVEKPDGKTAKRYFESGRYFWNAGIFVFKCSVMKAELQRFQPDICRAMDRFLAGDRQAYATCPKMSIDYAVMEHTTVAQVLPVTFGWSDLGSWASIYAESEKDAAGNHTSGRVLLTDCRNSYVRSNQRLVAGLGIRDLVVVETSEAVLIAGREQSQDVKKLVAQLQSESQKAAGGDQLQKTNDPMTEHRPWGSFTILEDMPGHKVKRLDVLPGKRLSLQLHHKRSEYWVVVRGMARVTRGEEVLDLSVGQSITIPVLTKHRLENPGPDPVSVIEVQTGTYFGEDDIVRFQDDFGRVGVS